MTFWQFLDIQFARVERNGFGCALISLLFGFMVMLTLVALIASKHPQ